MTSFNSVMLSLPWLPSIICCRRFRDRAQATEEIWRLPDEDRQGALSDVGFFTAAAAVGRTLRCSSGDASTGERVVPPGG